MRRVSIYFLILTTIFSITLTRESRATHIVGGELNYRYTGNNVYEIQLTVYRDCYNGLAPFDNPASIGIFDGSGNLYSSASVFITSQGPVSNVINSPCLIPPTNVCYEVAHYIFTTVIPPSPGGYTITYQRCCRNSTIANLLNVQGTGSTYFATIPPSGIVTGNSNPVFVNWPPTFICSGAPFTFDHSATDADGDSLVYSIIKPYEGADQNFPMPSPPAGPPYTNVLFRPPYSYADPFGGTPIAINPQTGLLTATPNTLGQFVYGVAVDEYRNGVHLSQTFRDFQVNVVSCPNITVASIFSPTIACGSLQANFVNTSYNAATYSWNFGDFTSQGDTSNLMNPSYVYPDTGDYVATLVAYSGINPGCNDTTTGLVHVYPDFISKMGVTNVHCSNVFTFSDSSYGHHAPADFWDWDFGDGTTAQVAPVQHTYNQTGTYLVRYISSADSGCLDTAFRQIHVLVNPISRFHSEVDVCDFKVSLQDSSTYPFYYAWNFGDGEFSSEANPEHTYQLSGTYTITQVVKTDSLCVDSSSFDITIPPLPDAIFDYNVALCDSEVHFTNQSKYGASSFWLFGDSISSTELEPSHIYEIAGTIPVKLITKSFFGCADTIEKTIDLVSYKHATYDYSVDSCSGNVLFKDVTENAVTYEWDFGDGSYSYVKNPVHHYVNSGTYLTRLNVNGETTCIDSAINIVNFELPEGEKLFVPNTFTPNGDGKNDFFAISVFRPCDVYSISIFNRWGQLIYENDDAASMQWDGTYQGEKAPDDVYVYILKREDQVRQGIVNLMR